MRGKDDLGYESSEAGITPSALLDKVKCNACAVLMRTRQAVSFREVDVFDSMKKRRRVLMDSDIVDMKYCQLRIL
jgi:hypothetical protein